MDDGLNWKRTFDHAEWWNDWNHHTIEQKFKLISWWFLWDMRILCLLELIADRIKTNNKLVKEI